MQITRRGYCGVGKIAVTLHRQAIDNVKIKKFNNVTIKRIRL